MTAPDAMEGADANATAILAAAAAMGGAQKRAAEKSAANVAEQEEGGAELAKNIDLGTKGQSTRFFIRNLGKLGEHHLQDYFQRFGRVLEISLVRDKKTQRPRGMAFVSIAPPQGETVDAVVDKLTGETHSINDVELDIQEALAKPEKEVPDSEMGGEGGEAAAAKEPAPPGDAPPAEEEKPVDPAAEALAQAQFQMHYLAMAINASVPEEGAIPKELVQLQKQQKGAMREQQWVPSGKGKGKGKAWGGFDAQDLGKGKGKGKGKKRAAAAEEEEAASPKPKAQAKPKAVSFKTSLMQELATRDVDEVLAEAQQQVDAIQARIIEGEASERATQQEVEEAKQHMDAASAAVEQAVGREETALERLKAAKSAMLSNSAMMEKAQATRVEKEKVVRILELEAGQREKLTELELAKQAAKEAAEVAKKAMEEAKRAEKEMQLAAKKAMADQVAKASDMLRATADADKEDRDSKREKKAAERSAQKSAQSELAVIEKMRLDRAKDRQKKIRDAVLGKGRGLSSILPTTGRKSLALPAPEEPKASPKRKSDAALPDTARVPTPCKARTEAPVADVD